MNTEMTPRRIFLIGTLAIALITVFFLGGSVVETNNSGFYQVKQAFVTGEMSVRNEPGTYGQMLGTITTYPLSTTVSFNDLKEAEAGEDGALVRTGSMDVTFQGNSKADVRGSIKYQLSKKFDHQLELHETYRSNDAIAETLVRQTLAEAIKNSGPLFTPEEARTTRREEYVTLVQDQTVHGLYKTTSEMTSVMGEDGNKRQFQITKMELDKDGNRIIVKTSPLTTYGVRVVQLVITGLDFDKVTDDLMQAKKKVEQEKVVARTNAEKAKQDTITEQEQGKARVAKAQADKLVEKIQAVTDAQKKFEVAEFERKEAGERAKSKEIEGRAEAVVASLKVAAGLSPLERAKIDQATAIGVAKEMANVKFPESMIIVGGSSNGKAGAVDPFTAVGLESFINISDKMTKKHISK